jgi:chemotaxis protein methyltransferase CheR
MVGQPLSDAVFRGLRDFIYERSGIFIPDTKKYFLENRLVNRLQEQNLRGYDEYLSFLKFNGNGNELERLFDAVTTNETYFFREPHQLEVFADSIVTKVIEQKTSREIRLWSAACSTGEEPYTLVMILKERHPGLRFEVVSSDLSEAVLESARRGIYGSYSTRNVPEAYLAKYFRRDAQSCELAVSVRSAVRFVNINLVDERKVRSLRGMDLIFCRNVLIYFDDRAKQKVVSALYDALKPGGFLFIGSSESLHAVTRAFRPVIFNRVVVYQKV